MYTLFDLMNEKTENNKSLIDAHGIYQFIKKKIDYKCWIGQIILDLKLKRDDDYVIIEENKDNKIYVSVKTAATIFQYGKGRIQQNARNFFAGLCAVENLLSSGHKFTSVKYYYDIAEKAYIEEQQRHARLTR